MAKQQRMGWWFLCLACVVVMVCTAQRMAGLHALQMQATAWTGASKESSRQSARIAPSKSTGGAASSDLALNSQGVTGEPSSVEEGALITAAEAMRLPFSPPRAISPPTLRVHLRFCVFRE